MTAERALPHARAHVRICVCVRAFMCVRVGVFVCVCVFSDTRECKEWSQNTQNSNEKKKGLSTEACTVE